MSFAGTSCIKNGIIILYCMLKNGIICTYWNADIRSGWESFDVYLIWK